MSLSPQPPSHHHHQQQQHTLHISPAETSRLTAAIHARITQNTSLAAQHATRQPRDPAPTISACKQAGLMADMSGERTHAVLSVRAAGQGRVPALVVGEAEVARASGRRVRELERMRLRELKVGVKHFGKVLRVRRVGPVVEMVGGSWTVVEDVSAGGEGKGGGTGKGDVERLEVVLHTGKRGEEVLDFEGKEFWVKEPWFGVDEAGEAGVRVWCPSDVVRVRSREERAGVAAGKWKERGNAALKKREFVDAVECYAQGLRVCEGDAQAKEVGYDLYRNKAHVELILNRWDDAKRDGLAAVTGRDDEKCKTLDSKAYFRAGSAAYALGEFDEAQDLFTKSLDLAPDDKEAKIYLKNITTRLHEQSTGEYDFAKLRSRLSPSKPRLDAAIFTAATTAHASPLAGRGLFAARDLPPGALILCEKALCTVWSHEAEAWSALTYDLRDQRIRVFPAGMAQALVQKLLNAPSLIPRVAGMFGDDSDQQGAILGRAEMGGQAHEEGREEKEEEEEGPVIDAMRIHDVICRNAFGPGAVGKGGNFGQEEVRCASTGLWVTAALVNHSCVPNAEKEFLGDLMVLRAKRQITQGEEITHAYSEAVDWEERARALELTWGFRCRCALCVAEDADGEGVREKRRELMGEAAAFVEREANPRAAKRVVVARAEKLVKQMQATYEGQRWEGLPKRAMEEIRRWVDEAQKGRR